MYSHVSISSKNHLVNVILVLEDGREKGITNRDKDDPIDIKSNGGIEFLLRLSEKLEKKDSFYTKDLSTFHSGFAEYNKEKHVRVVGFRLKNVITK